MPDIWCTTFQSVSKHYIKSIDFNITEVWSQYSIWQNVGIGCGDKWATNRLRIVTSSKCDFDR